MLGSSQGFLTYSNSLGKEEESFSAVSLVKIVGKKNIKKIQKIIIKRIG